MQQILDMLASQWLFDVNALSQPWMYWWALVPAVAYASFMFLKWVVLTMPVWVPLAIVVLIFKD
jgi:hypothetical protein